MLEGTKEAFWIVSWWRESNLITNSYLINYPRNEIHYFRLKVRWVF